MSLTKVVPVCPDPIEVYSGDSWEQPFTFRVGDPAEAEDLSGWSGWLCHWRKSPSAADAVVLTVDVSAAAEGLIVVSASPAQTAAMGGRGVADLQAVDGEVVRTFVRFSTVWAKDVTRG